MKNAEFLKALDALNTNRLVCDVTEWLVEREKANCDYQEDLYIYIRENGSYELENFVNVGGNSWIADPDALLLTAHKPLEVNWADIVNDIAELAEIIGEPLENLIENVALWADCDAEDVSLLDAISYVGGLDYADKFQEYWESVIEGTRWEIAEQAAEIVDDFCGCLYEQLNQEGGDI